MEWSKKSPGSQPISTRPLYLPRDITVRFIKRANKSQDNAAVEKDSQAPGVLVLSWRNGAPSMNHNIVANGETEQIKVVAFAVQVSYRTFDAIITTVTCVVDTGASSLRLHDLWADVFLPNMWMVMCTLA